MNRKTFDPDADELPHTHGQPPLAEVRQPCRWCGESTLRTMLAQYGARCFRCFEAYCAEAQLAPVFLANPAVDGSKAWAWALKAREEHDPRSMTEAQRAMWRAALQVDLARQWLADEEAEA